MSNKLFSQLIILVALSLLILFGRNLCSQYQNRQPNEYLNAIKNLNSDALVRIELVNDTQNAVIITKQNGMWQVLSKKADLTKVNSLIGGLLLKQSPAVIAQNKELFPSLNLASGSATTVKFITTEKEYQFLIGKKIENETAVLINGIDKAFGIKSFTELGSGSDFWIDKTVIDIDSLQVKQLSYTGTEQFVLNQTTDKLWAFAGSDQKVNNDGINTYMYKFNPFKADNIASSEQIKAFEAEAGGFSIVLTDKGENKTEMAFKLIKDQYVVKRTSDSEYFVVSKSVGDALEMKKASFVASS